MRAVVQRVASASVTVDGRITGAIGRGLLVLVGVAPTDGEAQARWLAQKLVGLRIFEDDAGKMNLDVREVSGGILAISQFTLFGDTSKGRRPSFAGAAAPAIAEPLYLLFCDLLAAEGVPVGRGVFGAHMDVDLRNDGPVTLVVETP
jgi:D-tyrosyl-tRNA(Tyr) deacylase